MSPGAAPRGGRMREHPLAGSLPRKEERPHDPRDPVNMTVRKDDGSPVGMRRYCEMVTPGWQWDAPHLLLMDQVLDAMVAGTVRKVIFQLPPRHGKTEKTTIRFAPYLLELNPFDRVIAAAYGSTLARKFSRKMRRIARTRPLLNLSKERQAAEDWETEEGGGVRAVGFGEGVTGLGANWLLIDDPVKNRKEAESATFRESIWEAYTDDLTTRLEPDARVVVTMTRWHEDDLVGRILASEDGPNWLVVTLPAIAEPGDTLGRKVGEALWPERYPLEVLAARRRVLGERSFSALFQQQPTPAKGLIFDTAHVRFYTVPEFPIRNQDGTMVPNLPPVFMSHLQSWDMSFKDSDGSDNVAGHVYSRLGADVYLRDRAWGQMDFPATVRALVQLSVAWPQATLKLIEDKANGPAIIASLRSKIPGLVPVEPEGGKVARAWAVSGMVEAGNLWFPHPQWKPWVKWILLEMARFPFGKTDDDVDALTQALLRFMVQIQKGMGTGEWAAGLMDEMSEAAEIAKRKF